jgi:hypothetical protein
MKILSALTIFLCLIINCYSQITLDHTFSNQRIDVVHLRASGPKYYTYDYAAHTATLYNLDYSVFRTVNFPASYTSYTVNLWSEDLFDNDSTTLEYVLSFNDSNNSGFKIYTGDTTMIFEADSGAVLYGNEYGTYHSLPYAPIFETDSGMKMVVAFTIPAMHPYETRIYNLPGKMAESCSAVCLTNGVVELVNKQERLRAYPNPFHTSETIEYSLPREFDSAELIVTDQSGKLIKQFPLSATENKIETINAELPAGNYIFTVKAGGQVIAEKKVVKVN